MHDRRSIGCVCGHWPLQRARFIKPFKGHASKGRRKPRDFVHDFGRVGIVPIQPHRLRQPLRDFPVLQAVHRRHHLAHRLNAAFGIGERAIFFKEGRSGQEDMRVVGGLVQEKIVDNDTFHRRQPSRHMGRVWIGLKDVFALAI